MHAKILKCSNINVDDLTDFTNFCLIQGRKQNSNTCTCVVSIHVYKYMHTNKPAMNKVRYKQQTIAHLCLNAYLFSDYVKYI